MNKTGKFAVKCIFDCHVGEHNTVLSIRILFANK
jgi:hypothetical protein